jgi:hypothetical protein
VIAPEPGIDEPPVWHVVRRPAALLCQLVEVRRSEPRLEDHRAGDHTHAARPPLRETALRRDRQRLDALGIARPPRHVHLGRGNRRGDAAVHVAFEKADGALARRVVPESDVHVGVDQARDRGHAARVDDHVGGIDGTRRRGTDRGDALAIDEDRVARDEGDMPVARDDLPEIDDRDLHAPAPAPTRPGRSSSSASS